MLEFAADYTWKFDTFTKIFEGAFFLLDDGNLEFFWVLLAVVLMLLEPYLLVVTMLLLAKAYAYLLVLKFEVIAEIGLLIFPSWPVDVPCLIDLILDCLLYGEFTA